MCATKTADVDATVAQIEHLVRAGADIIRVAVDTKADAQALAEIRQRTKANLSCDLQENYRLAADIAPVVDKIRYNPGHLYHHERTKPWQDKVKFLADVAGANDCAIRVGVNCGSIDPAKREKYPKEDRISPMIDSALEHCELLDQLGFTRYVVSLKNSDPAAVVEANRAFAARRPDVPLHLGVTEAGMPPEGVLKTQRAFEQLLAAGIGDTIRVSLTVPAFEKEQEILAGRKILNDIAAGRFVGMPGRRLAGAEHHFLPELLAGRELGLRRSGGEGPRGDALCGRTCDFDCRDGLPRERARRDRHDRSGAVVRAEVRQSEARRGDARIVHLRRDPAAAEAGVGCADCGARVIAMNLADARCSVLSF